MNKDRSRSSLLDAAWLLIVLYFCWSFLWRSDVFPTGPGGPTGPRGPTSPAPELSWPAPQGAKWQPDPSPLQNPLDPENQWERLREEKNWKGRGGP
jgi:hypothetical protein